MVTHTSTFKNLSNRHTLADTGQAALVMVIGFTLLLTIMGGVMVNSAVNNAPILTQASLQRLAYRALDSGLNAYQSAINANPYLAACNSASGSNPQCSGITYQSWTQVAGTNKGNGIIPELYMFDNPQEMTSATTGAVTYLEVQIVGAAGFPGNYVYYSTVAHFTPQNDFLNNVWWSNFESSDFPNANASDCAYFWSPAVNRNVNNEPCTPVEWQSIDNVTGPVLQRLALHRPRQHLRKRVRHLRGEHRRPSVHRRAGQRGWLHLPDEYTPHLCSHPGDPPCRQHPTPSHRHPGWMRLRGTHQHHFQQRRHHVCE
jgi:hypothetical protein